MTDHSISIIIPAYNVEQYLKAALDSIQEQDQLPDEIILIDDGSTDRTLNIAQSYHFPVPYQIVSIENQGQGNARNLGVNLASSEYIYFFDSDDLLAKNFIKSLKDQITKNKEPDIILFSGRSFNDSKYQGDRWINYNRNFSGTFTNRTDFLNKAFSHHGLFCSPCLYVSKKSLWGEQGLKFGANYLEDEAIFYPVIFSCSTFVVLDEVFFLRRNREGSTMTIKPNIKHVNGALNCMETTLQLYQSNFLNSTERWHIRKRLGSHCITYIIKTRQTETPLKIGKLLDTFFKTKSPTLAIKSLLYILKFNQLKTMRWIYGFLEKSKK